jgi:hypothetical protein
MRSVVKSLEKTLQSMEAIKRKVRAVVAAVAVAQARVAARKVKTNKVASINTERARENNIQT